MSYLKFNKAELVNLEYSLKREILSTNRTGGYCNTTIIGCNTRKYHGLFVLPIENFGRKRHLLLSSLDETLIQHDHQFNLGIRCYGNAYEPRGHKYVVDFEITGFPTVTYRVGGMILTKSLLFLHDKEQLLVKYTLVDANSPTTLRIKPYLAFRDIHSLTKENANANTGYSQIENGASFNMYEGFPNLYLQLNKNIEYNHSPNWYNDVVYKEEERRGFEYKEDLFAPGYFEMPIKKGESIILSVSTSESSPNGLKGLFEQKVKGRINRSSFEDCLKLTAKQFFIKNNGITELSAGYSWLGRGLRETLISMPGLTIFNDGDLKAFDALLEGVYKIYSKQLLKGSRQADAALWLFWVAQQYADFTGDEQGTWLKFRKVLKDIIASFINGSRMGVELRPNGLLYITMNGVSMSWMNAYDKDGNPITERSGYQVETNSLWYNAISYVVEMETKYGKDKKSVNVWNNIVAEMDHSFYNLFWVEEREGLADYVTDSEKNVFTRPNQMFACALNYSPLTDDVKAMVLKTVKQELVTTHGLRTLSPKNPLYKGIYDGNQSQRDHAYHQGSTRTWLLGSYIDSSFRLFGDSHLRSAEELVEAFEEDMTIHGVGSVSELYDWDPPHYPHGAISHALGVAELLRAKYLISKYKKEV